MKGVYLDNEDHKYKRAISLLMIVVNRYFVSAVFLRDIIEGRSGGKCSATISQTYRNRGDSFDVPFDIIKWMIRNIGSAMPYCRKEDKYNYSDYNGNSTGALRSQHLELVEQWK